MRTARGMLLVCVVLGGTVVIEEASAEPQIVLQDGRILEGKVSRLPSMAQFEKGPPGEGAPTPRLVVMLHDGLRRYFLPARRLRNVNEAQPGETLVEFEVPQPNRGKLGRVANLGPIVRIQPFDDFGRRIFVMQAANGPMELIQGITRITPRWTRVEGLQHEWDMRIATSSIPKETLAKILDRVIDRKNSDHRMRLATFYIQSDQFNDARDELQAIVKDFPGLAKQVEPSVRSVTQAQARRIVNEIRVRADAGQHALAYRMLTQFPVENVAGQILQGVRGLREEYENENQRAISARRHFDALLAQLNADDRRRVLPARDEIFARRAELSMEEVNDWLRFVSTLGQQASAVSSGDDILPSPGRRIMELMAADAREAVLHVQRTGEMPPLAQQLIYLELKLVLRKPELYADDDFGMVRLSDEARALLKRDPQKLTAVEVARLNRLLFESAYPDLVEKSQFAGLTMNTLVHLEAFLQFADQKNLQPGDRRLNAGEKLALAVSGWVLGSNSATPNLSVATSLWETRVLVQKYLREPLKLKRDRLLEEIRKQEGAGPETIAKLLANLPPPVETKEQSTPGFYELEVAGDNDTPPIQYFVQLPPEYDPQGRYPVVVALHGLGTVPAHSVINPPDPESAKKPSLIDWWAGSPGSDGIRRGQSMRHGYIIIAPAWARSAQKDYEYSGDEHRIVLTALRDAMRRFAIDADRVFLSGHSMGGDAAWDIGLSHPDLWAGVIPIVASSRQFCTVYYEHANYVPFYVVGGELDENKLVKNAYDLDRYMKRGYDVIVAEFLGRGHEHFADEILQLFDWMKHRRREFHVKEFETKAVRPFDNFFWWVELAGFPKRAIAQGWPLRSKRPIEIDCKINTSTAEPQTNFVRVRSGAARTTIWLSPELIDFDKRTIVTVDGRRVNQEVFIEPDIAVILEDARTRGDRQHPFWAKLVKE